MNFLKKNKFKLFLLLIFVFYFFSFAIFANALEIKYPQIFGISITEGSLPQYAKYFFNVGIFIVATVAGIVIAFGGIYFLVDLTRGKFASEGKEWIKAGIAGLLLTTCAYLIAFTINPYLVIFDLTGLAPLTYIANIFSNPSSSPSLDIKTYNEIPIGSLTESLLSRTMNCYDYDDYGDPIDGEKITTDDNQKIIGPTYLEHDRVDCVLKLSLAVNNKARLVEDLSDKISNLMDSCSCSLASSGVGVSGETTEGSVTIVTPGGSTTTGGGTSTFGGPLPAVVYCENKTCSTQKDDGGETSDCKSSVKCSTSSDYNKYKVFIGTTNMCKDSCSDNSCKCSKSSEGEKTCDRCPEGYKEIISHGPICLTYLCGETNGLKAIHSGAKSTSTEKKTGNPECGVTEKEFMGIDEFKSEYSNDYELIKKQVEVQPAPKVDGKEISIIKSGGCELCDTKCSVCNPDDKKYSDCIKNREDCTKKLSLCENKRKQCLLKSSPWYQLRLIDQLTYLRGKLEEIKNSVTTDLNNLNNAETELGKCYLADSYVDFLKTYEATDKTKTTVLISQSYSDQDTGKYVNPAKYCEGFQYNNSTCYSQCKKICPGNQSDDINCYSNIKDCSGETDEEKKTECATKQKEAYEKCLEKSPCTSGASSFSTFKECFLTCKQSCLDNCNKLCNEDDKTACQNKCNGNSKCIVNNADKCLVDLNKIGNCSKKDGDKAKQDCIKSATRCQYCSDQYAGYADCLTTSYSLQGEYSASYIYSHPDYQICSSPNKVCNKSNNFCNKSGLSTSKTDKDATCITLYPETTKCPSNSKCPECPCGYVEESSFSLLSSEPAAEKDEYRICSGDCDKFSYNDDPLTFYCNTTWWTKDDAKKETAVGEERLCLKSKEIPVGQTVDNAETWGQDFLNQIKNITDKTNDIISYIKYIGEQKEYCQCNSKCDDNKKEAACQDKCIFQATDESSGSSTNPETGEVTTYSAPANCWCARQGCSGNPCQKIINLLKGKDAEDDCPKGTEYKGVTYYTDEITTAEYDFYYFTIQQSRSDIVKELNYSRKTANDCSTAQNNYGVGYTQLLSCTRTEDEIISPNVDIDNKTILNKVATPSYCYGKELGIVTEASTPLMDNWFCCEMREKSPQ